MRLERLVSIVFLLLNHERIAASELAEKFDVSVRTIYRDINTIDRAGIPIVSHTGQNGGFGIMDTYRIDKQVLSIKEMGSIVTALKGVNKALEDQELDLTIEKISSLIPGPIDKKPDFSSPLAIDLLPWGEVKNKNILQQLYHTANHHKIIEIKYSAAYKKPTKRIIEPMTLFFKGYAWYLFAFCRLRQDYRIFKISRIKEINGTNKTFTPKNKDYREVINISNSEQNRIDLKLKFSPKMKTLIEEQYYSDQLEYLQDGHILVRTQFPKSEWVYGYILSFGHFVEVLEPEYIREIISESAEKIKKIYQP